MMLVQLFVAVMPTMMTLYVDYEKTEWEGRAYIAQTPRSFMREA